MVSRITIDFEAIRHNWRLLGEFTPGAATGAAAKANAYGLGLEPVVQTLHSAGCRHFFVATIDEGFRTRQIAGDCEIFVLAGVSADSAPVLAKAGIIPVINSLYDAETWAQFNRGSDATPLPCALNFDTGFNRLGLRRDDVKPLAGDADLLRALNPTLVMSHLACADDPQNPMTSAQKLRFDAIARQFPGIRASLANSAGILQDASLGYDLTRPGIALYGGEAIKGTIGPMTNVVTFEARVLQVYEAEKGETVGYGATAKLGRDSRIAIVGVGYADGVMRSAGAGGAKGWLDGHEIPVLGRVSMDFTAFDVTDVPQQVLDSAQWVEIFGKHIALDDFARSVGTIGYEVLTGMSRRAQRNYLGQQEGR